MSNPEYIEFRCLEVTQPIGTFYTGAIACKDLLAITYADIRRLEDRDIEQYLGIQRPLDARRVKEIRAYVQNVDASFPTGIIVTISSANATYDREKQRMQVLKTENVAKIIDGQHRLDGLQNYDGEFELLVVVFVDMELEDQANIFATINLAQTKVNKSLVYDLYDLAESRSPQKTCHNVCRLSNKYVGSPFYQRIKILGIADPDRKETITQALFVERLLKYVSRDPRADRDALKRKRPILPVSAKDRDVVIFRDFFVNDRDEAITRIIWNFFEAVEERWPAAWKDVQQGVILNRSTGFMALMRFLRPCYISLRPVEIPTEQQFYSILSRINLSDAEFTADRYKPGSNGPAVLYQDLIRSAGLAATEPTLDFNE